MRAVAYRTTRQLGFVLAFMASTLCVLTEFEVWTDACKTPDADHHHCPDSQANGAPCGDDCSCVCCRNHAKALTPSDLLLQLPLSPIADHQLTPAEKLHPIDFTRRVFHPPRHPAFA